MSSYRLLLSAVILILTSGAYAADVEKGFQKISHLGRHYEDPGAVCEEIARTEFEAMYPSPQYEVIVGIAYNWKGRTIGELDMVLMDKNLNKVVMVGEVKCFKDLRSGLGKAKQQRKRFMEFLSSERELEFVNTKNRQKYQKAQFQYVRDFISISQRGGKNVGFDYEMEYDLDEMAQIREKMLQCQSQGACPKN